MDNAQHNDFDFRIKPLIIQIPITIILRIIEFKSYKKILSNKYNMSNISVDEVPVEEVSAPAPVEEKSIPLTAVEVVNENVALNVMVSFLNIAQKRGAFSLDESAKIWECIQKFIQRSPSSV